MITFLNLFLIFVIGSFFGWILEFFYRRFVSVKHWINPGFLSGPFLPIYGTGTVVLYLVSTINLDDYFKIFLILVGMTTIEYLVGLFFVKVMHIKLWDYSNMRGNIQGIICPIFTIIWGVLGFIFVEYLSSPITHLLKNIHQSNISIFIYFSLGFVFSLLVVDIVHSFNIASKVRTILYKTKSNIIYEKFKVFIGKQRIKHKNFIIPIKSNENIQENVKKFLGTIKKIIFIEDSNKK